MQFEKTMVCDQKVVLVTGGTGLVGHGIRTALERESEASFAQKELWVFVSSADANLRYYTFN